MSIHMEAYGCRCTPLRCRWTPRLNTPIIDCDHRSITIPPPDRVVTKKWKPFQSKEHSKTSHACRTVGEQMNSGQCASSLRLQAQDSSDNDSIIIEEITSSSDSRSAENKKCIKAFKYLEIDLPLDEFIQITTAVKIPISSSVIQNVAIQIRDRIVQIELRYDIVKKRQWCRHSWEGLIDLWNNMNFNTSEYMPMLVCYLKIRVYWNTHTREQIIQYNGEYIFKIDELGSRLNIC